jgi:carbon-monoxide dehydrogenase medium subunit
MTGFREPATLAEAAALGRRYEWDGKYLSGGTAVVLMLQQRLIHPEVLISLRGLTDVPGWRQITVDGRHLVLGAGVTLSEVADSPLVRHLAPSLAEAASVVGNVRVRNAATVGGNVAEADYASDPPAVLVDLGAEIEVRDEVGTRLVAAADMVTDFFTTDLRAGEIVTAVRVPLPHPGTRSSYTKYRSRSAEDRPCVGVAASLRLGGGTVEMLGVVVGAVAGTPQRWTEITAGAVGRTFDSRLAAEIAAGYADAVDPLDDVRGSAWYRREMVRVLVRRSLESLAGLPERSDA